MRAAIVKNKNKDKLELFLTGISVRDIYCKQAIYIKLIQNTEKAVNLSKTW